MKTPAMFMALSLLSATVLPAAERAPATSAAATPADAAPADAKPRSAAAAPPPAAANRVELDTTQITGNRELPRVLYVVPWKRADLGETSGKPAKSLLDEVLAPLDRDVFRRQNRYHGALQPDTAVPGKVDAAGGER